MSIRSSEEVSRKRRGRRFCSLSTRRPRSLSPRDSTSSACKKRLCGAPVSCFHWKSLPLSDHWPVHTLLWLKPQRKACLLSYGCSCWDTRLISVTLNNKVKSTWAQGTLSLLVPLKSGLGTTLAAIAPFPSLFFRASQQPDSECSHLPSQARHICKKLDLLANVASTRSTQ